MSNSKRLVSLDVLRGLTVALMIFVNNGAGNEILPFLVHSKWNGLTLCDMVFPFFLFMVGISTYLSLEKYEFKPSAALYRKIIKRTVLLFLIGLAINWLDMACDGRPFDFAHLRIWGVMQRIALCYGAVSIMVIHIRHKHLWWIILLILTIYATLIVFGNGCSSNMTHNVLSIVDRWMFGEEHLYHKSPVDPEGLLSTIPAIAHTMIGFVCCYHIKSTPEFSDKHKAFTFKFDGFIMLFTGICVFMLLLGLPINKRIWSPSYVLVTCGAAAMIQGFLIQLIDNRTKPMNKFAQRACNGALIFGINPLFLYVTSEVLGITFGATGLKNCIYGNIMSIINNGYVASLIYATLFTAMHAAMGWYLFKKRIYIKL